ncbi:MAG TPA: hypothetical protein VLM79_31105 [Kofleriaceae bacterium]|nr:hypothetical protein [Kofleriaceae bacterium]
MRLVCTLEMSKERGISLTVTHDEAGITQTVTMDGTTLTLKVDGGDQGISTITQTADRIAIKCKDFSVEADNTISCKSKKAALHHSDDALTLESAKDMKLTSSAKLMQSATTDLTLAGTNVTATAQSALRVHGATTEIAGDQALSLKAEHVGMRGAQVAIAADAQLGAESSGIAKLGGSMTTIKGTLINAG